MNGVRAQSVLNGRAGDARVVEARVGSEVRGGRGASKSAEEATGKESFARHLARREHGTKVSEVEAGPIEEPLVQGSAPVGSVQTPEGTETAGTSTAENAGAINAGDASAARELAADEPADETATVDETQGHESGDTIGSVERDEQDAEGDERTDASGPAGGVRHEAGDSVEVRLAALGQGRPITIDQITQLLLQVDPTLAARGLVKGLGSRQAIVPDSANPGVLNGAEWAAFAGAGAEGFSADGAELDSGEKLEFSFARHGAGVDGEVEGNAEHGEPEDVASGMARVRGAEDGNRAVSQRSGSFAAAKSIWTVSVMPAAAGAFVNAGPGGLTAPAAARGSFDGAGAAISGGTAAERAIGSAGMNNWAGGSGAEEGDSSEAQRRAGAEAGGVAVAGADGPSGAAGVKAPAAGLEAGATGGAAGAGAPGQAGSVARQELLAAQIDRALAATVERSSAGRTSHETVLQLSPRVLGRIRIAVTVESNKASVRMRVENPEARQLLNDSMPSLVAALQERGIEVESVQIRESEAESVDAEQPSRGAESLRKTGGWNPKRSERASAGGTPYGGHEAGEPGSPDVIVALRLDALA